MYQLERATRHMYMTRMHKYYNVAQNVVPVCAVKNDLFILKY